MEIIELLQRNPIGALLLAAGLAVLFFVDPLYCGLAVLLLWVYQ